MLPITKLFHVFNNIIGCATFYDEMLPDVDLRNLIEFNF